MTAIWKDVEETRHRADELGNQASAIIDEDRASIELGGQVVRCVFAGLEAIEALRLEIRAASQTISHALTVHAEELRDINRGR